MENPSKKASGTFQNSKRSHLTGLLVLVGSLILVYIWLQGFILFTVEIPANGIGMSNLCSWQVSLSNDLVWSGNTAVPFLIVLHLSGLMFLLRMSRKKPNANLPMEFGVLNLLFVAGGTALFILSTLLTVLLYLLPGSQTWNMRFFGCEPAGAFLPGMFTITIVTAALLISQATGWLERKFSPKVLAGGEGIEKAAGAERTNERFIIGGGILLSILTLALLLSWFTLFFVYAVRMPAGGMWSCWGSGCEAASWQGELSQSFAFSPTARFKPFLLVFHLALIVLFFRFRRKEERVYLPFEFGTLILLFTLLGALVFTGSIAVQKAISPPAVYLQPVSGETDGALIGLMPLPPQGGFTARDETGFITMSSDDGLAEIYSRIPWEINGKVRAWAGVIAAFFLTLGLMISLGTGWLNKIIRQHSGRTRRILLSWMLFAASIILSLEIYLFGFRLFG